MEDIKFVGLHAHCGAGSPFDGFGFPQDHMDYAHQVCNQLKAAGFRLEVNSKKERMNLKIRDAQNQTLVRRSATRQNGGRHQRGVYYQGRLALRHPT